MTIFCTVIKDFLLSKIEKYIADSNVLDGMYGTMRDLELSEAKRDIAKDLKHHINELTIEGRDKDFLHQIQKYIQTAEETAAQKGREKGKDGGSFDELMRYLIVLACSIEFKMDKAKLTDVEHDKADALSVFSYYVALYHTKAIMFKLDSKKGLINKLIQFQKGQWGTDLSDEKDALISEALSTCRQSIDDLDKSRPTYKEALSRVVRRAIEDVKSKNEQLCRERGVEPKVSVGLTLFSALNLGIKTYTPSKGELENCMDQAHEAIEAIHFGLTQTTQPTLP